ncbi:MAG TPA: hypothetical protein PKB06_10030, partial [Actinotalea sp.]|nr:hypothetical protein [Actinotalea sp.]
MRTHHGRATVDDELTGGTGRRLTRRELRALEAARTAAVPDHDLAVPAEHGAEPEPELAGATLAETTWSDEVRWSLHGELPR